MYETMTQIAETTQQDPLVVIEQAIRNATPLVEVKARRVGGSTYQVPLEVLPERGTALAIRWILAACRVKSGRPMTLKLTSELIEASKILEVQFENVMKCIKWLKQIKHLQNIDSKNCYLIKIKFS